MGGRLRVTHAITGLSTGGAEMTLYRLLSRMDCSRFQSQVVSLTCIGPAGKKIEELGVPVRALGMRRGVPDPLRTLKLAHWFRQEAPDAVQTWMYHADLVGGLAAKLAGGIPVSWGIRHGDLRPGTIKRTTIWTAKVCARLSRWLPARIVCCSEAARDAHVELGYAEEKIAVIPNGYDTNQLRPDPGARTEVRSELQIPPDTPLVGLVGRFDPQKDHRSFFKAAGFLHKRMSNVHFLLCGDGISWDNRRMTEWVDAAGIRDRCHLLGPRDDIPRLNAALDIATSSSLGEGFPNVVAEAMACGVPCVVTDVGGSAEIVRETGRAVPPGCPEALADAWYSLLALGQEERLRLGAEARRRIEQEFSLPRIVARYERLYEEIAGRCAG